VFFVSVFLLGVAISPDVFPDEVILPEEAPVETDVRAWLQQVDSEENLIESSGKGFSKVIKTENSAWYDCGKITPKEKYDERGIRLAKALRASLLEVGLTDPLYLWGALALVYHESRGNPCVTGPGARKWIFENGLLKKEKHWTKYDADDIRRIVKSKAFKSKKSGIDSGISQTLYPRNTKLYDLELRIVRHATIDEMVTVEGGAKATAFHMMERFKDNPKYPWLFWPGYRDDKYAVLLQSHVRRMGGPYDEMVPKNKKWVVHLN
jgi:hypothetical protein